jgi:hypothetical protein
MAEKSKSAKPRKSTTGKSKAKSESGVEVLLEDIRDKMWELASEAQVIIKEAGSTSKKAAGRALEGTKKKAGEAAAHLPVVGDGKKPKAAPKRATSAKASAAKSSTAKSSNGASKSTTDKKKAAASAKPSAAKSSAGSKSKKS